MVRRTSASVILNRKALSDVGQGIAAGMADVCQAVLDAAQVPDAPPYGKGLVKTGAYGVWYNGRKIGGTASKPRGLKLGAGIVAVVGYGFPGRFQEMGTVNQPAQPFLMPAWLTVRGSLADIIRGGQKGGFR